MKPIGQIIFGFAAFFACCMLSSCGHQKESIPFELVDIDSALMKGDYRKGEILLDEYEDQLSDVESEDVLMYHKLMRAFLRYRMGKESNRISLMDSICNHYDQEDTKTEYALSSLIIGDAYRR